MSEQHRHPKWLEKLLAAIRTLDLAEDCDLVAFSFKKTIIDGKQSCEIFGRASTPVKVAANCPKPPSKQRRDAKRALAHREGLKLAKTVDSKPDQTAQEAKGDAPVSDRPRIPETGSSQILQQPVHLGDSNSQVSRPVGQSSEPAQAGLRSSAPPTQPVSVGTSNAAGPSASVSNAAQHASLIVPRKDKRQRVARKEPEIKLDLKPPILKPGVDQSYLWQYCKDNAKANVLEYEGWIVVGVNGKIYHHPNCPQRAISAAPESCFGYYCKKQHGIDCLEAKEALRLHFLSKNRAQQVTLALL